MATHRNIYHLLIILKEYAIGKSFIGLCILTPHLFEENMITLSEWAYLDDYIFCNVRKEFGTDMIACPYCTAPRLKWLDKHIKINKPKMIFTHIIINPTKLPLADGFPIRKVSHRINIYNIPWFNPRQFPKEDVIVRMGDKVQVLNFVASPRFKSLEAAIIRRKDGTIHWIDSSYVELIS